MKLIELKKNYEKFRKKYKLPGFSELNQEFEIEKIHKKETEFLLREIRRAISDKIAAFLRFFEMFMNPQSAPVFILAGLKTLGLKDKEIIAKIYHKLVSFELASISRDIVYDEKKEAAFISALYKEWKLLRKDFKAFSKVIEKIKIKEKEMSRKSYFG